jgi:hypothetical protein
VSYFLRVFCTSAGLPPLAEIFEWTARQGVRLDAPSADLDRRDWQHAEIVYEPERAPFVELR